LKIDLHTHSKTSSSRAFLVSDFHKKVSVALQKKLDAFVQLEHLHAADFFEFSGFLKVNYRYEKDYYLLDGLKVFVGVEVSVSEKHDIVLIGRREDIVSAAQELFQRQSGKSKETTGDYISAEELIRVCGGFELIKILAHPFRHNKTVDLSKKVTEGLDAVEINSNEISNHGEYAERERVERLADKLGVSVSGGSDAHNPARVGCVVSVFDSDCSTIGEIKEALATSRVEVYTKK